MGSAFPCVRPAGARGPGRERSLRLYLRPYLVVDLLVLAEVLDELQLLHDRSGRIDRGIREILRLHERLRGGVRGRILVEVRKLCPDLRVEN